MRYLQTAVEYYVMEKGRLKLTKIIRSTKTKFILGFATWFAITMTALKWFDSHEVGATANLTMSLAFTFSYWAFCGGLVACFLWRQASKEKK